MKQRKLFTIREFEFKDEGLFVHEKNLTRSHETVVSYEDFAIDNLSRRRKTDNIIVLVTVIFGVMSVIFFITKISGGKADWSVIILSFCFALLGSLITYINWKREVVIPLYSSGFIILFENIPNKNEVDQFIVNLRNKTHSYLMQKYAVIDHDLPIEGQLNNFVQLRERKVIDDDKFRQLKESLLRGKSKSNIGFRS